ncbi:rubrerythrin family protein [Xanthobacter autotrophicus]|uniref:rubrerythrin family protein n=1 Tax=Xanthobacter TaxID=279 RepID=UPI0024AC149C|nr:rubrerythrin family protein [Xanthobacter autotrophicus]MDI4665680.1 rubrerythrin family protein [Xanthobacter autotrophicus]
MTIIRNLFVAGALVGASLAAAPGFSAETLNPQTQKNLEAAMHGEAFANLKYQAYAEQARKSGHPEIAKLFDESANVEANEHFAREADALGLVKTDEANLLDASAGERYENTEMYVNFAKQAAAVGDKKVAELFRQIAADEGDHYAAYKAAAEKLRAGK